MSGECRDCGNALCICDYMAEDIGVVYTETSTNDFFEAYENLEKETTNLKLLLKEVYDYLDVENEGCTKDQYELIEKIREVIK